MQQAHLPSPIPIVDTTAFTVWLSRTLKTCHEEAVHEPIPVHLLDLLPSASREN